MSSIDWDDTEVIRRLQKAVDAGVTEMASIAADAAARSFGRDHGGIPSAPGFPPNTQTGQLRNSIVYVSPQRLGTPGVAAIGSALPYARILELGGVVRAKKAKALPVPINPAAKKMLRSGVSLRTYKLVMIKRDGKPPLLVEKTATGRDKKNGAVFVLKKSITIRARPYLSAAVRNSSSEMQAGFMRVAKATFGV